MADTNRIALTPEIKDLLERFSNHLYARRGMALSSTDLICGYLRRMFAEIGTHPTEVELERYVAGMRRSKASFGHLVNCLRSIEHYMAFIGDPIKFRRPRRPINTELKVLSEGKITLIIAATQTLRERTLVMLLAYTGCRNNELINLRICDIDIGLAAMTIQTGSGKGAHGRIVPLAGECVEILMNYLRERRGRSDDWLFVTVRHGHKLQTQDLRKIIRVLAKRAGVDARVWPHLFRHSLATALLGRGASIYSIQAILGHTFISTTLDYYLHPNSRSVKADYHRCAPSFL